MDVQISSGITDSRAAQMMVPSSAKSSMTFSSKYGEQDLSHESLSDKKRHRYAHCNELSLDGTGTLSISNFCAHADSNHMCKRRKLQKSTVLAFPVDSVIDGVLIPPIVESPLIKASVMAEEKPENNLVDARVDPVMKSANERECAKSDVMNLNVFDEDRSLKELCIAVLRNKGLLQSLPARSSAAIEAVGSDSASTEFCRICGHSGHMLKMLICDHCEGAFHKSCCNPRITKNVLSLDEWFCAYCSKLEHKSSADIYFGRSLRFGMSTLSAKRKLGPIEYMLRYPEQHISRVRIGEDFQAEVPEWSGENSKNVHCIGEPPELDPVDTNAPSCYDKIPKRKSITNWLQCREPLYDDAGKPMKGTICGKWRRAPLSESQTDDWDCFCSVRWDPRHSDCGVPQEVETDEVLSQSSYIEQLKSRLAAKRK